MTTIVADRPSFAMKAPRESYDNDSSTTETEIQKIEKVPLEKRMVAVTNILLLIETHKTTPKQLIDWCECAQSTLSRLLSRAQYCDYVVEKIAQYYHLSVQDLGSTFFQRAALARSFPRKDDEISEKREMLNRIGKNITLLCKQRKTTDNQLGDYCECSDATIRQVKKGIIHRPAMVEQIAKFFKCTSKDLCGELNIPSQAEMLQTVASNIKLLMQHHHIKGVPLALWCKCSDVAIDKLKNGHRYYPKVVSKIAAFFHVTVSELASADFKTKVLPKSFPTLQSHSEQSTLKWNCFAANLLALRKKLGIEQKKLATYLRVNYKAIASLEKGTLHDEELAERTVRPFNLGYIGFFGLNFVHCLDESTINSLRRRLAPKA